MRTYRNKKSPAVLVEAEMLDENNVDELANLAQAQIIDEGRGFAKYEALNVKTPNGKERLHPGMYLVKVGPDFYTMSAANFEQRYELLTETEPIEGRRPIPGDDPWKGVPRIGDENA